MKVLLFIASIFFISGVFALQEKVIFNGVWDNGSTLYSNVYPYGNYTIIGRDVYPNRSTIIQPQCNTETICVKYNYTLDNSCTMYNSFNNRCILWIRDKVKNGCLFYETKKTCTSQTPIICKVNGIYTNQLSLKSFKYSIDGIVWKPIPYSSKKVSGALRFKLDIPKICSPTYLYNDAIVVS